MPDEVAAVAEVNPETLSHEEYTSWRNNPADFKPAEPEKVEAEVAEAPEPEAKAEGDADSEPAEKSDEKPDRLQKRFSKLTAEKRELAAKIQSLEQSLAAATAKPAEAKAEAKPAVADGKPNFDTFNGTFQEFTEALTEWTLDQREKARTAKEQERAAKEEQEKRAEKFRTVDAEGREAHEDWDEVVSDNIKISPAMQDVIADSEHTADLVYYLGSHPEEAAKILKMGPVATGVALGKIEAAIASEKKSAAEKAKVSAAPPPLKPVGSKSSTSAKGYAEMSLEEYRKARESGRIR